MKSMSAHSSQKGYFLKNVALIQMCFPTKPFHSHLETAAVLPGVFDLGWITSVEVRVSSSGLQPENK